MRSRLLLSLLLLLLLSLLGWGVGWLLDNYEQRSREIRADVSPLARRNPLLAAEWFLDRLGIPSDSLSGRDHLLNPPSQPGLLLVNRLGGSLPPARQQALREWVAGGGHLVIAPEGEWDESSASSGNTLLDSLGVQPVVLEEDKDPQAVEVATDSSASPLRFRMPGSEQVLSVNFSSRRILLDSHRRADWWVEGERGAHLLQFRIGAGRVTVLSDHDFFSNERIGEQDHALFLALLAQDQTRAWLLYSSNMPSLMQLLWRHAPGLMIALICLLLLLVWRLTRRIGPLLPDRREVRRNLLEHLSAVGRYIWRNDHADSAFRRTQEALEQAWRRRHPVLQTMRRSARCEWIGQHAGISGKAVEGALYGVLSGERSLIQLSAIQQRLAACLRSH